MKKTLLTLSMLLLMFAAIAQNQISELQKGMVFHWAGNEWYPTKDLVSNTTGTATAVYNISDKQGSGNNRYFSFNGTSDYITLPTLSAFGSADFSITGKIKTGAIGAIRTIIGGATNSFELYISATGYLTAIKYGGSALTASTTLLAANTEYTFAYVRSSTTGTYYVNGTAAGTCTDSNNYSVACTLVGNGTGYFDGCQFMVRAFNYALSSVINYSKPEYPIEYSDRDGAGNLCVLDLNSSGLSRASDGSYNTGYWTDRTNSITATASGAVSVIPPAGNLNATWFNGSTSKISMPDLDIYTPPNDQFTFYAEYFGLDYSTTRYMFAKHTTSSTREYTFFISSTKRIGVYLFSGGNASNFTQWVTDENVALTNSIMKICFTYNNGVGQIYLNGMAVTTTKTVAAGSGFSTFTNTTSPLVVGCNEADNLYGYGYIKNAIIYKQALEPDRIKLLNDIN